MVDTVVENIVEDVMGDVVETIVEDAADIVVETFPQDAQAFFDGYSPQKRMTALKIIAAIDDNGSVTVSEMAKDTGISDRTVLRYLKEFQEAGLLKREGSDKFGKWIIVKEG